MHAQLQASTLLNSNPQPAVNSFEVSPFSPAHDLNRAPSNRPPLRTNMKLIEHQHSNRGNTVSKFLALQTQNLSYTHTTN